MHHHAQGKNIQADESSQSHIFRAAKTHAHSHVPLTQDVVTKHEVGRDVPEIVVNMTGLQQADLRVAAENASNTIRDQSIADTRERYVEAVLGGLARWRSAIEAALDSDAAVSVKGVHKLRVQSRRLEVMLRAIEMLNGPDSAAIDSRDEHKLLKRNIKHIQRLRKKIKKVRSAAGALRDCDVHLGVLDEVQRQTPREPIGLSDAYCMISAERQSAATLVSSVVPATDFQRIEHEIEQTLHSLARASEFGTRLTASLHSALSRERSAVGAAANVANDHPSGENFHAVRLGIKRLRYISQTLEMLGERCDEDQEQVTKLQESLGDINDISTLAARLRRYVTSIELQSPSEQLATTRATRQRLDALATRFGGVFDNRVKLFCRVWGPVLSGWMQPQVSDVVSPVAENHNIIQPAARPHRGLLARIKRMEGTAPLWIAGKVLAVIDIGSNSVRSLIVRMQDEQVWEVLSQERSMTRLGHGLAHDGQLDSSTIERTIDVIERYKSEAVKHKADDIQLFATAAVREAKNAQELIDPLFARTKLTVKVLSGEEEGLLTFESVASTYDISRSSVAIADLGGGSLEVVQSISGVVLSNVSMPLGAVRMTEKHGGSAIDISSLRRDAAQVLERNVKSVCIPSVLIGCGGTFTTLAAMVRAAREGNFSHSTNADANKQVHNESQEPEQISRRQVRSFIALLIGGKAYRDSLHESESGETHSGLVPGLAPDRADIIVAGLVVIDRLMKHLRVKRLVVHSGGIRDGLIRKVVKERLLPAKDDAKRIVDASVALAKRCSAPMPHSEHVAGLALKLYDAIIAHPAQRGGGLIADLGSSLYERELLYCAAVLHDCGQLISYAGHHKHSCTIIQHNLAADIEKSYVEVIAMVSRYHRKKGPSTKRRNFGVLSSEQQSLVRRLTAILRVADGLDRGHRSAVEDLVIDVRDGSLIIKIVPSTLDVSLDEDLAGAMNKADVLEKLIKSQVMFFVT